MKIEIPINLNPADAIRRCGYGLVNDPRAEQVSFSRRLGQGIYPRFHAYINGYEINLHLDQKQASYEGAHAHNGEYDSEPVTAEGERIAGLLGSMSTQADQLFEEELEQAEKEDEAKEGFFSRLFK